MIWLFVWFWETRRPRLEDKPCQLHPVVVPHSVQILQGPFRTIFVLLQLGQISPYNISDVPAVPEGSVACATGMGDETTGIPACQSGGLI